MAQVQAQKQATAQMSSAPPPSLETAGACVLALDGGGVKGLSSLYILRTIMHEVNKERQRNYKSTVKPHQIFDLICGTSTGGLIAIMLGHLMMDVDECITTYNSMCQEIFENASYKSKLSKSKGLKVKGCFDHTVLEESISKTIAKHLESCETQKEARAALLNDGEDRDCKVFVCATKKDAALTTARFRNYETPGRDHFTARATILQAARATSAATSFFEPIDIDGFSYVDGATGANNPSQEAWEEARDLWKRRTDSIENVISCFISIGCGNPGIQTIEDGLKNLLTQSIVNIATETEKTAKRFQKDHGEMFRQNRCFRFNVERGLEQVGLEEWKKIDVIKNAVDEYLQEENTGDAMESAKERLVHKAYPMHPDHVFMLSGAIKALLDHLFFEGYKQRQDDIGPAAGDTFAWIHERNAPGQSREMPNITTFQAWLEQDTKVYWIKGKAGSGKSTMTKRLVSDVRTMQMLSQFAEDCRVHTAAFFFYELAKPHFQNTVEGALRSILYQLIGNDESLAEGLFSQGFMEFGRFRTWTLQALELALRSVLVTACKRNTLVCLFIDGLDEMIQEEQIKFASILQRIHGNFPQVLLCVSSRPTFSLTDWIPDVCQLDMATCNWEDIFAYATAKLESLGVEPSYIRQVATEADGVFLWAVLVTQRMIHAHTFSKEDLRDDNVIAECLADKGLDGLIEKLLVNARGSNTWFYFGVATLTQRRLPYPVVTVDDAALLTAARYAGDIYNYEQFAQACDLTTQQVVAQSGGLLSYVETAAFGTMLLASADQSVWGLPQLMPQRSTEAQQDWKSVVADRQLIPLGADVLCIDQYMHGTIAWLHRSVYEFIEGQSKELFGRAGDTSEATVVSTLVDGLIRLLVYAPAGNWDIDNKRPAINSISHHVLRIVRFLRHSGVFASDAEVALRLDRVKGYLLRFDPAEFGPNDLLFFTFGPRIHQTPFRIRPERIPIQSWSTLAFWSACVKNEMYGYVREYVEKLELHTPSCWILVLLLRTLISAEPRTLDEQTADFLTFVMTCLESQLTSPLRTITAPVHRFRVAIAELQVDHKGATLAPVLSMISWRDDGEDEGIMRSLVVILLSSWLQLHRDYKDPLGPALHEHHITYHGLEDVTSVPVMPPQARKPFTKCLRTLQVFVGLWPGSAPFMSFQTSAPELLIMGYHFNMAGRERSKPVPDPGNHPELDLRIVCTDPGTTTDAPSPSLVVWNLRSGMDTRSFVQLFQRGKLGDPECHLRDDTEGLQMIIKAVEKNEDRQLDAWQQRYMIACIKCVLGEKEELTDSGRRVLYLILSEHPTRALTATEAAFLGVSHKSHVLHSCDEDC